MYFQLDYDFQPVADPDHPGRVLDLHALYNGLMKNMQAKVRYNMNELKADCYSLWMATPEAERAALLSTPAFARVDVETWPLLCAYFNSQRKQVCILNVIHYL